MGHRTDYIKATRRHLVERYGPWASGLSLLDLAAGATTTTLALSGATPEGLALYLDGVADRREKSPPQ